MRENAMRFVVAALVAAHAAPAGGHEFECEKKAGLLKVGPGGLVLGEDGLPSFQAPPTVVSAIGAYPTTLGFEITLRNLATAPSVVTAAADPLLEALGRSATWFGTKIEPGLSVPIGGAVKAIVAVTVPSQEACLSLFGGGTFEAPVCENRIENRFVVEHDVGSAECRARVVCGPAQPPAVPCATEWGGPKALAAALGTRDVAVDPLCNVNVTGFALELPLPDPPVSGPAKLDALLVRLDATGAVDQERRFGAAQFDTGYRVAVDAAGNRFVWWKAAHDTHFIFSELYVSRFDAAGTEVWRQVIEAKELAAATGIALDAAGDPFVTGYDFDSTFIAKLDAGTGAVLWTKVEAGDARFTGIAVDPAGDLLVSGHVLDYSGPESEADAFVAKLTAAGAAVWTRAVGTAHQDLTSGIAVDAAGNAYVAGSSRPIGESDAFLTKVAADGAAAWTRTLDAAGVVSAADVAVTGDGSAWMVGSVNGAALPGETWAGATDAFVARYDTAGTLVFVEQFGTANNEVAEAVAVDALGNGYVTYDGNAAYVVKLDPTGAVH